MTNRNTLSAISSLGLELILENSLSSQEGLGVDHMGNLATIVRFSLFEQLSDVEVIGSDVIVDGTEIELKKEGRDEGGGGGRLGQDKVFAS